MSLSSSYEDSPKIAKLTNANWTTWIEWVKDYILALDHDLAPDIWNAYKWTPDPDYDLAANGNQPEQDPADYDYQVAANAEKRKLRVQHNKAFQFIRKNLCTEIFNTTIGLSHSVPKLLRHLQNRWNDGTTHDKARLRQEYTQMKLDRYKDINDYITHFTNKVAELKEFNIGLVDDDEDVLYQFKMGLPSPWDIYKGMANANSMNLKSSLAFFKKTAAEVESLPGSTKIKSKTSKVNFTKTQETDISQQSVCRYFAKGKCKSGDRCKYKHPNQPTTGDAPRKLRNPDLVCGYCGVNGHNENRCFKKNKDNRKKEASRTHITQADAAADEKHAFLEQTSPLKATAMVCVDAPSHSNSSALNDVDLDYTYALDTSTFMTSTPDLPDDFTKILMVIDGASTTGVVEDKGYCVQVRPCNKRIKVGGDGSPTFLTCLHEGLLPIKYYIGDQAHQEMVPVKIMPGFGCNILPESHFLKKGMSVNKLETTMVIKTRDGDTVLTAEAKKFQDSWLFQQVLDVGLLQGNGVVNLALHFPFTEAEYENYRLSPFADSAPYFEENQLQNYNKERGILHVQSPPYTLELNGLAERTIDTGWCYHHHPPFYARHDRRYPHQAPAARVLCAFCV